MSTSTNCVQLNAKYCRLVPVFPYKAQWTLPKGVAPYWALSVSPYVYEQQA